MFYHKIPCIILPLYLYNDTNIFKIILKISPPQKITHCYIQIFKYNNTKSFNTHTKNELLIKSMY